MKNIPFSPPDISDSEIEEVVKVLKSGWITSGPEKAEFEKMLCDFYGVAGAMCLSSATVCMELTLRVLGIGEGDEVITSAYTYTASASVIHHVGAKIVLVDTKPDSFEIDYDALQNAITEKTKVIIPVDIGGRICDYDRIYKAIENKKHLFRKGNNELLNSFGRIVVLADAAHSLGSKRDGQFSGQFADFTSFSFHAVKNLTTAEGGAIVWKKNGNIDNEKLYKEFMLYSLHGQNKDALKKTQAGSWEYDILFPGYKCNMTDIQAALGVSQLKRYKDMILKRQKLVEIYEREIAPLAVNTLIHKDEHIESNCHLYLARFPVTTEQRNKIIADCGEQGVTLNVHYKPLPMLTAYKNLGFKTEDYKNSYDLYHNEITFPLYSTLSFEDQKYVIDVFKDVYKKTIK